MNDHELSRYLLIIGALGLMLVLFIIAGIIRNAPKRNQRKPVPRWPTEISTAEIVEQLNKGQKVVINDTNNINEDNQLTLELASFMKRGQTFTLSRQFSRKTLSIEL